MTRELGTFERGDESLPGVYLETDMRPRNIVELCGQHTQGEIAQMFGVTGKTIQNWCRHLDVKPGFRCLECREVKPRERCVSYKRCIDCDEAIRAGSFEGWRRCAHCGETKSTDEFYLTKNGTFVSYCKPCRLERLNEHQAIDDFVPARESWPWLTFPLAGGEGRYLVQGGIEV